MASRRQAAEAQLSAVVFDGHCFGCGPLNSAGLRMEFTPVDGGVECFYTVPDTYQSWHGVVHGGIGALMLDEAVGWAAWHVGRPGVTGKLDVRYRKPLEVGKTFRVAAKVDRTRRSLVYASAEVTLDGEVLAEAHATLMAVRADVAEGVSTIAARRGLAQFG